MAKLSEIFLKNLNSAVETSILTKAQIARRAGMVPQQLTVYLSGKSAPGLDVIERLAEALQVEALELLSDKRASEAQRPLRECFRTLYALIVALNTGDTDSPLLHELYAFARELPKKRQKARPLK